MSYFAQEGEEEMEYEETEATDWYMCRFCKINFRERHELLVHKTKVHPQELLKKRRFQPITAIKTKSPGTTTGKYSSSLNSLLQIPSSQIIDTTTPTSTGSLGVTTTSKSVQTLNKNNNKENQQEETIIELIELEDYDDDEVVQIPIVNSTTTVKENKEKQRDSISPSSNSIEVIVLDDDSSIHFDIEDSVPSKKMKLSKEETLMKTNNNKGCTGTIPVAPPSSESTSASCTHADDDDGVSRNVSFSIDDENFGNSKENHEPFPLPKNSKVPKHHDTPLRRSVFLHRPKNLSDVMRPTSSDLVYSQSHNIFLRRNYKKTLSVLLDNGPNVHGQQSTEDPTNFGENGKIVKTLYEFWRSLTTAKDSQNRPLLKFFMSFCSDDDNGDDHPLDLTLIGSKILAGEYLTFKPLEDDLMTVFTSLSHLYVQEKTKELLKKRRSQDIEKGDSLKLFVEKIKKVYVEAKNKALFSLKPFIVDGVMDRFKPFQASSSRKPSDNNAIIRCFCGTFFEHGLMVRCTRCHVLEHAECVGVYPPNDVVGNFVIEKMNEMSILVPSSSSARQQQPYTCEKCTPRYINPDIIMEVIDGKNYCLTLARDDGFLVRRLDTVYVLREQSLPSDNDGSDYDSDVSITSEVTDKGYVSRTKRMKFELTASGDSSFLGKTTRHNVSYKTAGASVPSSQTDIFRVEGLWKVGESRWVFGRYFFRPNEVRHQFNRKFYKNELLYSPYTEIFPIEAIQGRCWVLHDKVFTKGRPVGCEREEDVYICQYRTNKEANMYYTIKSPLRLSNFTMKPSAFNFFENRITIQRNFYPHAPLALDSLLGQTEVVGRVATTSLSSSNSKSSDINHHHQRHDVMKEKHVKKAIRKSENVNQVIEELKRARNETTDLHSAISSKGRAIKRPAWSQDYDLSV